MASIRKRGPNSYMLVVSMGRGIDGKRKSPKEKTVHPPEGLTPKALEKWLQEEAALFERECKNLPEQLGSNVKLAEYTAMWLRNIAPKKLAKRTLVRTRQDIDRFLPVLGNIKLKDLKPEHFKRFYAEMRQQVSTVTGRPFSENTVGGVHACLCGILSDAMDGGYIQSNPAWRTYKPVGPKRPQKHIADEETARKLLAALEQENIKYEVFFKIILFTGIRRGECCGIQWGDVDWHERSIHICRNVVKITGEEVFTKETKTVAGDRYVYFSESMEQLLRRYKDHCEHEPTHCRPVTAQDFLFRRQDNDAPMTPSTFTSIFKEILLRHGLPDDLTVHSLRHTAASLMIANGTDVATVAGLLGHSQISTTLDIYTHAFDGRKREASRLMQERLEK